MNDAPFKYSGRKLNYVDQINSIYNNVFYKLETRGLTYIEPFLGSGSIFYNLELPFKNYILNDLDPNVIKIHKAYKENTYEGFYNLHESIRKRWPDFKDKEAYYEFRNWFNKNIYNKENPMEGFYLQLLFNTCINSMGRFGPNGFNQSYGNRDTIIHKQEDRFNKFHDRLQGATLYNLDFFELIKILNKEILQEDQFLFLDPPYIRREAAYKTITNDFFTKFISYLKNHKGHFIYTDIYEGQLDMPYETLRETMSNTSPLSQKEQINNKEVVFYNF